MAPPGTYPIQRAIAEAGLVGFGPPDPASPLTPDAWMARLGELPLMAQPGEQWLYTAGSNVLGVLIARAAGQALPAFLHDRIFEPLGMTDTAFFAPAAKIDRLPAEYRRHNGQLVRYDDPANSAWAKPPAFPAGDSGLVSTVDDMFAFSRFMLDRGRSGGRQLLSEASIAAMTRDHLTAVRREGGAIILGRGHGWGYGLAVTLESTAQGIPGGAYGWNGGLGTSWIMDPASDRTAIVMTQTMFDSPDPPDVHKDFWRALFGPIEA
jgi:CubicO group peptidase (beta-lactamase class C family)